MHAKIFWNYIPLLFARRNGIQMGFKAILGEAGESLFETLDLIKEYGKYKTIVKYSRKRKNRKICVLRNKSWRDKTEQHIVPGEAQRRSLCVLNVV